MTEYSTLVQFFIAIALGGLIGLEREHAQVHKKLRGYGGIRTFPLIALLGALAAYFAETVSFWIFVAAFVALAVLITISHYAFATQHGRIGLTTEMAGLATFFIGALSAHGFILVAVTLGVLITLLLYERTGLHLLVSRIRKEELYSTIKFAIIAFVILPVLPDRALGPFGFFNPRTIWLIVVLVSAISFGGYILIRLIGERGAAVAGFLGGFVSSTATMLSLAQQSRKSPGLATPLFGAVAANLAMMLKVLFLVFLLNREVFLRMLVPVGAMIGASVLLLALLLGRVVRGRHAITLRSPFTLKPALQFALIFAAVLLVVKSAIVYIGQHGAYIVAFLSGMFDSDSVVLSVLQLAPEGLAVASTAAVLAVIANTFAKSGWAFVFGERVFAERVSIAFASIALLGAAALVFF